MQQHIRTEYRTLEDVIASLTAVEQYFLLRRDRRGIFVTAYLHISREIRRRLTTSRFLDADWVARYLICFGNLYRRALLAYEEGNLTAVPKAWRLSFDAARAGTGLVTQHLILGINAHINHDLALALAEVGIDPDRPQKYRDHTAVNLVLEEATAGLQDQVAAMYAPVLHRLDRIFGGLDERATNFSIPKAREHAWTFAVALTSARGEQERRLLRQALDEQAAVLARLALSSPTRHRVVLATVRFVERLDTMLRRLRGRGSTEL